MLIQKKKKKKKKHFNLYLYIPIYKRNIDFSSYDIPKPDFSEFPILSMLKTL